jgi:hypothetical protein
MNTKKLIKYAAYYTAIASVYNYAINSMALTSLPKLPNPALAAVNGIMGASAPLMLTQATGGYGWG